MILCATHGALFRIEDGHCLSGPCVGESLTPLPVSIEGECGRRRTLERVRRRATGAAARRASAT